MQYVKLQLKVFRNRWFDKKQTAPKYKFGFHITQYQKRL